MKKIKALGVLSTAAVSGLVAAAAMSSSVMAATDAYLVKDATGVVYSFDKATLVSSFLDAKQGKEAPLFADFSAKLTANGFYAFHDSAKGFVDFKAITTAFMADRANFKLDTFTEAAKDEAVLKVAAYKNVTVEAGKVVAKDNVAPVADKLDVASVSATNLKEVVVTFNKAVTLDDTKSASDYFAVKSNTVAGMSVSDDKMSITLTLGTTLAQQADVEVTVKKLIGLEADKVKTINVIDTTLPVAKSIALTGPNTFDITFSEPVQGTIAVELENGIYGTSVGTPSADGRTVTVTTGATLAEGKYAVKISGYKDFANFNGLATNFTLNYVKDVAAPVATIKKATQTDVTVEFSKPVLASSVKKENFYHTYTAWQPLSVTPVDADAAGYAKTYTVSFATSSSGYLLPEGNVNVFVLKSTGTSTIVDVKDAWGNKMAVDAKLVANIVNDTTAPTVTKVEAIAENKLAITFSEDVVDPAASNIVIKDKDGKVVTATYAAPTYNKTKKYYELNLSSNLAGGNYTVEIKDVKDTSLSGNKMVPATLGFTVTDKTPINIASIVPTYVLDSNSKLQYIYVPYQEAVATTGANSALVKENYLVQGVALSSEDKVELFDAKTVKITLATPVALAATSTAQTLTIGRIADLAGNVPTAMSTNVTLAADTAPSIFTAKMIGLNKVQITFAGVKLSNVTADAFTAAFDSNPDSTFASATYVIDADGNTVVTGTIKATDALANKAAATLAKLNVKVVANKLKTITGQTLGALAAKPTDAINPALIATTPVAAVAGAKIDIKYDEAIKTLNDQIAATDLILVDKDGKNLVAGVDYTVAVTGTGTDTLEVSLTNASYKGNVTISTKPTVTYITDNALNTAASVTANTVEIK